MRTILPGWGNLLVYQKENRLVVATKVAEFLGEKLLGKEEKTDYFQFSVLAADAKALIRFLKNDPELGFTYFIDLCGADYLKYPVPAPERFAVLTTLISPKLGVRVQVRAYVSGAEPRIATLSDVFEGANWTEREVWDLYGIEFLGHPNLKRILTPDDYEGYPLRKDYPQRGRGERGSFPVYHAVPGTGPKD